MQLMGIALGGGVAILWGTADSIATLSTRRLSTFTTTFISQLSGLLILTIALLLFSWLQPSSLFTLPPNGILIGLFTGLFTAIGYLALYRSLELGPVAITSPLSSTSAVVTLLLSMLLLQEQVSLLDGVAMVAVITGVLFASIDIREVRLLFKPRSGERLLGKGIFWACMTPVSFGLVDIGIGGSTALHGWFAPVFFSFAFSTFILSLLFLWRHSQRSNEKFRSPGLSLFLQNPVAILFAVGAGALECIAVLTFGLATQIIKPGLTAAIASNYSLIAILFGVFVLHERLMINQKLGIGMVMSGLTLLTILRI